MMIDKMYYMLGSMGDDRTRYSRKMASTNMIEKSRSGD